MCGISGLANCGDGETLARMTSIQAHRGPDDAGLWDQRFPDGSYIALGSRRLAIPDLSPDGHMPMCNSQRTLWITYNGEIYNFRELREELKTKGYQFVSDSDTEVVLRLYESEGPDCVKLAQPKAGFAAPIDYWLAHNLKEMTDDLLSESRIRQRGLFRPEVVRGFVEQHRNGTQDGSMQIWQFLTLEIWMQTFPDASASQHIMTGLAGRATA